MTFDRRGLLLGAASMAGAALWRWTARGESERTRVILLGTGGGPRPRKATSAAAQVIISNGAAYVVDCGDGVARQLVLAGVALACCDMCSSRTIIPTITRYGNLIWLAWAAGLRDRVDTWGPPPLENMTRLFFEMNAYDIRTRIADEGRVPLAPLVHVHELPRTASSCRTTA